MFCLFSCCVVRDAALSNAIQSEKDKKRNRLSVGANVYKPPPMAAPLPPGSSPHKSSGSGVKGRVPRPPSKTGADAGVPKPPSANPPPPASAPPLVVAAAPAATIVTPEDDDMD